jgi:hypothetical protein
MILFKFFFRKTDYHLGFGQCRVYHRKIGKARDCP